MKRKTLLAIAIALIAAVFCAFAVIPTSTLKTSLGNEIAVMYPANAKIKDNVLTICADYDAYGDNFEVVQDIIVSTDPDFSTTLELTDVKVENTEYTYTFATPTDVDKVYVAPPVVLVPETIEPIVVALHNSALLKSKGVTQPLFTIEDISETTQELQSAASTMEKAKAINTKTFEAIRVKVKGNGGEIIPRLPMLKVGDKEYGGIHTIIYDENNNFESGVFTFVLPQGVSAEDIVNDANAVISVSEVSVKSEIKTSLFNNDGIETLNVTR